MVQTLKGVIALALLVSAPVFAQQAPSCTIAVNPTTGQGLVDVTVTWSTMNAISCTASGSWAGAKDCAGGSQTFEDITQSRTFNLTVRSATGKMDLNWTTPVKNTDDTPTTISGFRLFVAGTPEDVPNASPILFGANVNSHTLLLPAGSHSAGIKAVRTDAVLSDMSNIVTKNIQGLLGTCSATVTVTSRPRSPNLSLSAVIDKIKEFFKG